MIHCDTFSVSTLVLPFSSYILFESKIYNYFPKCGLICYKNQITILLCYCKVDLQNIIMKFSFIKLQKFTKKYLISLLKRPNKTCKDTDVFVELNSKKCIKFSSPQFLNLKILNKLKISEILFKKFLNVSCNLI